MSQPEHVKDPSVEFVKSRLLGAAAEAKFVRDPKFSHLPYHTFRIFFLYTNTIHGIPPIVRTKYTETSFEFPYVLLH
jgi:hypothetical protein